jgi:hypothetical protein
LKWRNDFMYQNDSMKVLTGVARLSYAALTEPRAPLQGGEPKYSVTLLIPKSDMATKADIDASIAAAAQDGIEKAWKGVRPPMLKTPIHDGDGVRQSGEPYGDECKGCWVITASSKQKPEVVHISNVHAQLAPTDIYSGMYARVTIRFFAYANSGNKGIGCGLNNVLKIADGEPLAGHASAATDFDGMEQAGEPQVNVPYVPPYPQAPAAPQGYPQYAPQAPAAPAYPQGYPQYAPGAVDPITRQPIVG